MTELEPDDLREIGERRALALAARGRSAGIPPKWQGLSWDDLDREESQARARAVNALHQWATTRPPLPDRFAEPVGGLGVLLVGPVGIGKTRMAATAAQHRLALGAVRWVSVARMMQTLGRGFGDPDREKVLRTLETADAALVLDDLDKVKPSDHQLAPVFAAVDRWVDHQLPLLVTCNKTLEELERDFGERYGPPLASRLAEHCEVYEIRGRDRRVEP